MNFFIIIFAICFAFIQFASGKHSNNWAVILDTSRFWFNYRHTANALAIYRSVKSLGIPDSQIVLMIQDDVACDPRNPTPGCVRNNPHKVVDLYGTDIEVDYRGYEVTPENLIRVLTGRVSPSAPSSQRLNTDESSNILFYITGHGGAEFIKFQDDSELSSQDLADAFAQMHKMKRYNEILFVIETCQADTLGNAIKSPNIITLASSAAGENSYSRHMDMDIGVYVSDRFSHAAHEFLSFMTPDSKMPLSEFFKICPLEECHSHVINRLKDFERPIQNVLVTDFFGSVRNVNSLGHFGYESVSSNATLLRAIDVRAFDQLLKS
ncbi:hypothetical protein Ciccas_005494 [Cichlidogyrus casuarinus]|uniref:GPI-anchor transamidase n=1 Tax=Cichlidogyrus casuarinus TaxID=1844966 RepID=A0ABD2Q8I2_9PLAT